MYDIYGLNIAFKMEHRMGLILDSILKMVLNFAFSHLTKSGPVSTGKLDLLVADRCGKTYEKMFIGGAGGSRKRLFLRHPIQQ